MLTKRAWIAIIAVPLLAASAGGAYAAPLNAIGIENQYADIIAQIGGPYVHAIAIETDPNTDPHEFEASPRIAEQIAAANLVVENGLGYDDWADKMLAATENPARRKINVQHVLNLPDATENPHLWYAPANMMAVADAIATSLATLDPAHAQSFEANAANFRRSLTPILNGIAPVSKSPSPNRSVMIC
jgi:zinc/manganese transport system substrate-binding protein